MENKKILCHDCQKEIKVENGEIKNGFKLVYSDNITAFKCNDCFVKNKSLNNYQDCEVYSRVVGYLRPVKQWNEGKQEEFSQRKEFKT